MWQNMDATRGVVFSQRVLLALIEKGLSRERAYDLVQRNSMCSWDQEKDFRELLKSDEEVTAHLSQKELSSLFDYGYYLRHVDDTFSRIGLVAGNVPTGTALLE
jgi:adenylosuccinate lyase